MSTTPRDQLAFDEELVEDKEAEDALEERQTRKAQLSSLTKEFKEADDAAKFAIRRHRIPDGKAIRIGRFRIVAQQITEQDVEFTRKAGSRLRITVPGDKTKAADQA